MRDHKAQVIKRCQRILAQADKYIVLDTETTGLGARDEIVEISIIDLAGQLLFESRICPLTEPTPGAVAVHGLSMECLSNGRSFSEVQEHIRAVLDRKIALIYNAPFDMRMLVQSHIAHRLDHEWLLAQRHECIMALYAKFVGEMRGGRYKWQRLPGGTHGALGDAKAALAVLRLMAAASVEETGHA
jgi:DNA polymerase-3 subunit epsilon